MQEGELSDETSNDTINVSKPRRRKMTSRIMKSRRFGRGRIHRGRGRNPRKISQLIDDSINDDTSTNSENSENNALYKGVNWEENIEADNTLIDEFAPRINFVSDRPSTSISSSYHYDPVAIKSSPPVQSPEDCSFSYVMGEEVYVQLEYQPNDWLLAEVVDTDMDECEILVHYMEEPFPPNEWLKMSSRRISLQRPIKINETLTKNIKTEPVDKEVSPDCDHDDSHWSYELSPPAAEVEPEQVKNDKSEPILNKKLEEDETIDNEPVVKATEDSIEHPEFQVKHNNRPGMRRSRKSLKRQKQTNSSQYSSLWTPKFAIGEDVLAKWSDHRMQKFPAKIKSISSDGKYDVLFYDGFEKTITEDQLFKSTPEDAAKYKKANPSEADSFVDIDANSKEARRERKKKTFDDYVFAKDYRSTKRRVMKNNERYSLSKKRSHYSKSSELKDASDSSIRRLSRKKMKKRRRVLYGVKRDRESIHMLDIRREANKSPNLNFLGFDYLPGQVYAEKMVHKEAPADEEVPAPSLSQDQEVKPAPPPSLDIKPINITGSDGIIRKSVVIPDSEFPEGWSKHAVLMPTNTWEIHLLSTDGYLLSAEEDLKRYFSSVPSGGEAPASLNFNANFDSLPELMAQQKEIPGAGAPKVWFRKKPAHRGGRRRGSKSRHSSSKDVKSIGRVRTLLPRNRFEGRDVELPIIATPPPQPVTPGPEQDIWRCPKIECDKKFRKESLLQMHIKHYHSELSSLVRSVPNMVDLACARSESANADFPKISLGKRLQPRPLISSPSYSDPSTVESIQEMNSTLSPGPSKTPDHSGPDTLSKRQNNFGERKSIKTMLPVTRQPSMPASSVHQKEGLPNTCSSASTEGTDTYRTESQQENEGKKTADTFKSSEESIIKHTNRRRDLKKAKMTRNLDSENSESEDDCIEQKKNGSRIFKPGRFRRGNSRIIQGSRGSFTYRDPNFSQTPTFKVTKKRKLADQLQAYADNYESFEEERPLQAELPQMSDGIVLESLKSEEFINCICGYREEDGLMIQCDICMCWQHGLCSGIESETEVPERYVCQICKKPPRVRNSAKYSYAQLYLTQGKLPSFNFRPRTEETCSREMRLKRCYDLSSNLHEIKNVHRSLHAKINIAENPNHPKLYMWSKNWEEGGKSKLLREANDISNGNSPSGLESHVMGPQPEAPIDLEECRFRLLDHIEDSYSQIEDRLTSLQTQIAALESTESDLSSSTSNDQRTRRTIQTLIKDLNTIHRFAEIC